MRNPSRDDTFHPPRIPMAGLRTVTLPPGHSYPQGNLDRREMIRVRPHVPRQARTMAERHIRLHVGPLLIRGRLPRQLAANGPKPLLVMDGGPRWIARNSAAKR